ncbi:hypothetical protein D3C71_1924670 [compost metagenome]
MIASDAKNTSRLKMPKPIANRFFSRWVANRITPIKITIVNKIMKISNPLKVEDVPPAVASNIASPPQSLGEFTYTNMLSCPSLGCKRKVIKMLNFSRF